MADTYYDKLRKEREAVEAEITAAVKSAIAPLKLHEDRRIFAGDELVGVLQFKTHQYSRYKFSIRIASPRFTARGRYATSSQWGYRDYKLVESAISAIKTYCKPVTSDERRAKELREEIRHYESKVRDSGRRSDTTDGSLWNTPSVSRIIDGLISDDPNKVAEAEDTLHVLKRKARVHRKFNAWVREKLLQPRYDELDSLDVSKEKIP